MEQRIRCSIFSTDFLECLFLWRQSAWKYCHLRSPIIMFYKWRKDGKYPVHYVPLRHCMNVATRGHFFITYSRKVEREENTKKHRTLKNNQYWILGMEICLLTAISAIHRNYWHDRAEPRHIWGKPTNYKKPYTWIPGIYGIDTRFFNLTQHLKRFNIYIASARWAD